MNAPRTISLLLLAIATSLTFTACNTSNFAGSSRRQAKEPAIEKPVTSGTPGTGTDDGNDGPDGPDGAPDGNDTDGGPGGDTDGTDSADTGDTDGTTEAGDDVIDNPPIEIDEDQVAALTHACTTGAIQSYDLTGGSRAKVSGEICPRAFGKLTITFVVDFSLSMADADPDGVIFGCGRQAAARKIIARVKKDMRSGDDVQVALVTFGNDARIVTRPKAIADFSVSRANFCGAGQGATNYKRAFEETKNVLAGLNTGNHAIYFVSDGLPTVGGAGPADNADTGGVHKAAGLSAAQTLKLAVEKATLNAVFLDRGGAGQAARSYLEQITGNAAQVKVASDAAALADQAMALSIPKVELKPDTATAELHAPNFPVTQIKLELFEKSASKPGAWTFRTENIVLNKVPGATVENIVKIKAKDERGQVYEETMKIKTH